SLERAFAEIGPQWMALARELGREPGAALAHAPAAAANVSDLGVLLAWSRLVDGWLEQGLSVLVVCDDPWMFRHLAAKAGIDAGRPPPLRLREMALVLRGIAARARFAATAMHAAIVLRRQRRRFPDGGACLLVYAHPASRPAGYDAYFGPLMEHEPDLFRVLNTDAGPATAARFATDPRNAGLHAWGSPWDAALKLVGARWRPSAAALAGRDGWLVRRAAMLEGATGQGALARWTGLCLARWFRLRAPALIVWPWENHAWERRMVRLARRAGVRTLGYQHSVVGPHMYNYAAEANHDGAASLPDRVLTTGPATRDQLVSWGLPAERTSVGGALRAKETAHTVWKADAPIFVALPFDRQAAAEMVGAVKALASRGRRFLIKEHPIYRFHFDEIPGVERTEKPLEDHAQLSLVIFAATTVGLEALVAGIPAVRFIPASRFVIDVVPPAIAVATADAEALADVLAHPPKPQPIERGLVFPAPVWDQWRQEIRQGAKP
ncbi:MAG: hypothetical protein VW338_14795, partial [Rhodospirillaceae bacterium]